MPTTLLASATTTTTLPTAFVPTAEATARIIRVDNQSGTITFAVNVSGTGAVSATVAIYPIYETTPVVTDAPITLTASGTTSASNSVVITTGLTDFYAIVTAISGTGATVRVWAGAV